jgi:hypothetical protein
MACIRGEGAAHEQHIRRFRGSVGNDAGYHYRAVHHRRVLGLGPRSTKRATSTRADIRKPAQHRGGYTLLFGPHIGRPARTEMAPFRYHPPAPRPRAGRLLGGRRRLSGA